jgi:hypothetical protein
MYSGFEVEIGEVNAQKLSPWGADGQIDEEFGRGEISRRCVFVAWIVDAIATNGEPNAICCLSAVNNCSKCGCR